MQATRPPPSFLAQVLRRAARRPPTFAFATPSSPYSGWVGRRSPPAWQRLVGGARSLVGAGAGPLRPAGRWARPAGAGGRRRDQHGHRGVTGDRAPLDHRRPRAGPRRLWLPPRPRAGDRQRRRARARRMCARGAAPAGSAHRRARRAGRRGGGAAGGVGASDRGRGLGRWLVGRWCAGQAVVGDRRRADRLGAARADRPLRLGPALGSGADAGRRPGHSRSAAARGRDVAARRPLGPAGPAPRTPAGPGCRLAGPPVVRGRPGPGRPGRPLGPGCPARGAPRRPAGPTP